MIKMSYRVSPTEIEEIIYSTEYVGSSGLWCAASDIGAGNRRSGNASQWNRVGFREIDVRMQTSFTRFYGTQPDKATTRSLAAQS